MFKFKRVKSTKNRKKPKAFSMIELSIVILIIGVLISGILASNSIVKKFRIQTAQTLTISSPVNGITDSVLWLESSLDKGFKDVESSDTSSLSTWYDVRETTTKNNATQSNSGNYPTYSNSINSIQAVKFDGTNAYFSVDGTVLNDTNYTIFVLEQRDSNKSGNYFIGDSSSGNESTTNKNLVLGYSADGTIKHSQSSDNSYTSNITTYTSSSGTPRIFTFVHDKSVGKKTYINGLLAATSTDTNHLSGMTTLAIGKSYQGQIGEIVVFARALTTEERQSVEDYLGKKWNSKILRTVGNTSLGASCTGGTVSTTGCQLTCTVPTTTGITATSVSDGSGSLTCDTASHFTGSLSYNCSNGIFTPSGSCSCDLGYQPSGSTCVATTCTFAGVSDVTDGTVVAVGTGDQPCNNGVYSGSLNYTCTTAGGSPTINSSSCYQACTGGTITTATISGSLYTIHTFTSSGTLTCPASKTVDALVVAGGGGGGGSDHFGGGGGGGAGGLIYSTGFSVGTSPITVTVGNGGAGQASDGHNNGANGANSVFSSLTAIGGGGGGGRGVNGGGGAGSNGGSGGGSGYGGTPPRPGGTGVSGQGNAGGGTTTTNSASAGGGGGAGAVGSDSSNSGATGGVGLSYSITGTPTYYAGGGSNSNTSTLGGGGAAGTAGTANTGGGGGGSKTSDTQTAGAGGSGIVIIRYNN